MNVRFVRAAERQLRTIADRIARDNRRAAADLVRRIDARFELMTETGFVEIGQRGRVRGARQIVEGRYIVVYRYDPRRDEIVVVSVVHGARRR